MLKLLVQQQNVRLLCFTLLLGKQPCFPSQGREKSMAQGTRWRGIDKFLYSLSPQPLHFEQN